MADDYSLLPEQPVAISHAQKHQPQILLSGFGGEDHVSPTQVLDEAAVEEVDDDYWDVASDEEMPDHVDERDEDSTILSRDFSLIRRIHFENSSELAIRRYDTFIYDGILTQYKAEQVANPLKNPKTARVFAHFIHVTGPVRHFPPSVLRVVLMLDLRLVIVHLRAKSTKHSLHLRRIDAALSTESTHIHTAS
jgi:hypothetical protein